ncbi:hypothetical protein [Streptomyces antimicrobicus]|uniref:YcxB-like protein domain-containing protein n=1 Tax=Streptomyces antimicrobicus TaxID=2883108 RepID=A0ABS8B6D3_9ACTN|nr:hypothetical protein [Streptomyces antimicrobicus]MCB5180114.1 hypothetical protein [Streptomyces antimicrobicus]
MDDIRRTTVGFTGTLTRDEFDEAVRAWGTLRRLRLLVVVAAVLIALLNVRLTADGGSVHLPGLAAALAYLVFGLLTPRLVAGRMFRVDRARGPKRCVIDGTGITVSHGDEEILRAPWRSLTRFHETERAYVVTGRVGWKSCMAVLPKRLLSGPGEVELVGALLDTHLGRRR